MVEEALFNNDKAQVGHRGWWWWWWQLFEEQREESEMRVEKRRKEFDKERKKLWDNENELSKREQFVTLYKIKKTKKLTIALMSILNQHYQ